MIKVMKRSGLALWAVLMTLICGCAGGLYTDGYTTYLDANGDVVRAYPVNYDQTVRAGAATLETLGVMVLDKYFDRSEMIVDAKTPGGSPLRLRFVKEGRNLTVVRVRTGQLGYPGREYSSQFHAYLAARLKRHGKRSKKLPKPSAPEPAVSETTEAAAPMVAIVPPQKVESPDDANRQEKDKPPVDRSPRPTISSDATSMPEIALSLNLPEVQSDSHPPEAETDSAVVPPEKITFGQTKPDYIVFFGKDTNIPTTEALNILDLAAKQIQANPDAAVELNGYADIDEDPEAFHLVSESRTLAIKSYLIGKGIESRRIHTAWHGSHFAALHTQDKSQDRRVEIRLNRGL